MCFTLYNPAEEERAGCFALDVVLPTRDSLCPVSLPRRAVSWSVVCLSGIFWPYSLVFIDILAFINENLYIDRRYVVCAILLLFYINCLFFQLFSSFCIGLNFFMVLYNSNI